MGEEQESMNIRILYLSGGDFFNTQVNATTTLCDLFDKIFKQKQKFYPQYTLLFEGEELSASNSKRTLTSYGIKHGSCLNIIIHDGRNAEYIKTVDENGGVRTRLNVMPDGMDLFTLSNVDRFVRACRDHYNQISIG